MTMEFNAAPMGATGTAEPNAADLFYSRMQDADELPEAGDDVGAQDGTFDEDEPDAEDGETLPDADDEADAETEEDADHERDHDEASDEDEPKAKGKVSDDDKFVIPVDGEDREFSFADLKRAATKVAAADKRFSEAAETKKTAEDFGRRANEALHLHGEALMKLYERAKSAAAPFSPEKMLQYTQTTTPEDFANLTAMAKQANDDVAFFEQELQGIRQKLHEEQEVRSREQHKMLAEAADVAWKQMSDPKSGIPGWSHDYYNELLGHAVNDRKINPALMHNMVDPAIWSVLHDAYQHRKQKASLETKTRPVARKPEPKTVIKSAPAAVTERAKPNPVKSLETKLRRSGDVRDAADLFEARAKLYRK